MALLWSFSGFIFVFCTSTVTFPCFNVQKGLYFSHTACAAAPLFTLGLKPDPSGWPALL